VVARRKSLDRLAEGSLALEMIIRRCSSARRLASSSHATTYDSAECSREAHVSARSAMKMKLFLESTRGTKHDASSGMRTLELQTGKLMTDPAAPAQQTQEVLPHVDLGMSIGIAATITLISAILVTGATFEVVRGTLSSGMTRVLAVVSLLSLVAMFYGLIELALAVIATTAERRRQAREITERRKGDRARKPTPH
jgi:hypothetical protein